MKKLTQLLLFLLIDLLGQNSFEQITPELEMYLEKRLVSEKIPELSIAIIHDNGLVNYLNYGFIYLKKAGKWTNSLSERDGFENFRNLIIDLTNP